MTLLKVKKRIRQVFIINIQRLFINYRLIVKLTYQVIFIRIFVVLDNVVSK